MEFLNYFEESQSQSAIQLKTPNPLSHFFLDATDLTFHHRRTV
jgi:hypothetical protein